MTAKPRKPPLTDAERIARLERRDDALRARVLSCERILRIIGLEFEKTHLTEGQARDWANRARHLQNAMRDMRTSIARNGNEFDRAPHFTDPWRDQGDFDDGSKPSAHVEDDE